MVTVAVLFVAWGIIKSLNTKVCTLKTSLSSGITYWSRKTRGLCGSSPRPMPKGGRYLWNLKVIWTNSYTKHVLEKIWCCISLSFGKQNRTSAQQLYVIQAFFAPDLDSCFKSVLFNINKDFFLTWSLSSSIIITPKGSGWDGTHFPHISLYGDVFGFVTGWMSVTQQGFSCCWALHSTEVLWLLPQGGHEPESTARTAHPNRPKAHSTPHAFVLCNKGSGKGGGRRSRHFIDDHGIYLSNEPLVRSCFPGGAWTPACWWAVMHEILFVHSLWEQHLLFLLSCHCLSPWAFLPSFYFFPIPWKRGIGKGLGGCVAAGQGQLQHSKRTQVTDHLLLNFCSLGSSFSSAHQALQWLVNNKIHL